ncbi:MAG: (4Fe-4S)-binding protein, partial [Firmicutes bacterium]|nr:(4Fe-4S)-binding protein [Bacillota bacterium]
MAQLTQDDIKRVKGLGCIKDKRYEDVFNVRVPLGNGRITTEIQRAIAEAADRFGSGQVALTTRLSYEIQGVKYENIEPLRDFLRQYGLDSGGTGPKVRPVVCCKGTTCSFGLIDTYGLAQKLHEKFYIGMHDVALPGKFKIGVGGCPNNCIKPDLNDVGI